MSNDIKDLVGLEKPIVKLIETVREGVGVVGNDIFHFDTRRIKRIGEAKAEVDKQRIIKKAEGQAEAIAVLNRAGKRFALDQYNRQINLENIVFKSKNLLEGTSVDKRPVEKDWSSRFISVAQEISKEEIQDLLAHILAGEVRKPGTFSLRTLETLRSLSKDEIDLFGKFVALSGSPGFFQLSYGINNENLVKYNLRYGEFIHLTDIGLFNPSIETTLELKIEQATQLIFPERIVLITSEEKKVIRMNILKFTDVGEQLYPILQKTSKNPKSSTYFEDLKKHLTSKKLNIEIIKT